MKTSLDSNKITLDAPEGFAPITEEELAKMGVNTKSEGMYLRNTDIHMMVSVIWKKVPLLLSWVPLMQVTNNTARQIQSKNPGVKNVNFIEKQVGGEKAYGFRYDYIAQDIPHKAEYVLIKRNKKFYSFLCNIREENFDTCYSIFDEMLRSVKFN